MDTDLIIAIAIFLAGLALFALASWMATKPHNSVQPRMMPWRTLIFVFGVAVVFAAYNLAAQLGFSGAPAGSMSP